LDKRSAGSSFFLTPDDWKEPGEKAGITPEPRRGVSVSDGVEFSFAEKRSGGLGQSPTLYNILNLPAKVGGNLKIVKINA
jgi:hypothetical protein